MEVIIIGVILIKNIRILIFINVLLISSFSICSIEISPRINPQVSVPTGSFSSSYYSIGGGFSVNTDVDLFNMLSIGPEFGVYFSPLLNTGDYAQFTSVGISGSVFYYPTSTLSTRLGISGGAYTGKYSDSSIGNLWWKTYAEVGYRLSPMITLSVDAGYMNFNGYSDNIYSCIYAGLSAQLEFDTSGSKGKIEVFIDQPEPVFPLFYSIYKSNSIGTIKVKNSETAEIRNVEVSFKAGNYTASSMLCGEKSIIGKNNVIELPLYADFTEAVQKFTENGKIPGEITVKYDILGTKRSTEKTVILQVYNRNSIRWYDTASLASFVSPNSPEVLDFSKYVVGVARDNLRSGLNRNMQFAMYLFEGLKVGGISFSYDNSTPYTEYHKNPELIDYIQYPFQTLSYRLGDYDDLGLLYAASLESVGIRSGFIALPDDFIVAFSLDISSSKAKSLFNGTDNLLIIDDVVWIPLSMSVIREGFVNSWYLGKSKLNESFNRGSETEFIVLQDAWKTYSPSGISGEHSEFKKPHEVNLVDEVETDLLRYFSTEFGPKIKIIQEEIQKSGGNARLYNQLGLFYTRAGLYNEAKREYSKSAKLGSVAALVNLGNISMIENNYSDARSWYSKALDLKPDNKSALKGLKRAETELAF